MKAILVKNNNFETVGLEITVSGKTVLSWGVSSVPWLDWTKEINVNDWMSEIIEIIKLTAILSERENFSRDFINIAISSNLYENDKSVDFSEYDNETKRLEEKRMNIIKNII